jgi:superoxide dismutase, Cu-Zn family
MTSRQPRVRLVLILLAAGVALPLAARAATATLEPAGGSKAKGQVTFTQDGPRIRAMGELTGLAPGRHGLQVSEKGDCSVSDADGHGGASTEKPGGDFGSITASASGSATVNTTVTGVSIASLMGKGLVLRAKPDEKSDAGARVACGVVK